MYNINMWPSKSLTSLPDLFNMSLTKRRQACIQCDIYASMELAEHRIPMIRNIKARVSLFLPEFISSIFRIFNYQTHWLAKWNHPTSGSSLEFQQAMDWCSIKQFRLQADQSPVTLPLVKTMYQPISAFRMPYHQLKISDSCHQFGIMAVRRLMEAV